MLLPPMGLFGAVVILLLCTTAASAAVLQNGDFESPPSNIKLNSTAPILLSKNNTIPGWSFNGTVYYVTGGPNISLPGKGHGILLGQNGVIRQTIKATSWYADYILTFTIAPMGDNCSASTAVNVSILQPWQATCSVFLVGRRKTESWETHACYLGTWLGDDKPVVLEIRSEPAKSDPNVTCGPILDTLILKRIGTPRYYANNMLSNGGFETGPAFVSNSSSGVILEQIYNPSDHFPNSPLQEWNPTGIVNYIDAKHFYVPEGNAAIELISDFARIEMKRVLREGPTYHLAFVAGDANNSCIGEFILAGYAGSKTQNFTFHSHGNGSAHNFSMNFKADPDFISNFYPVTSVGFISYKGSQAKDGTSCGPMIDNVVMLDSSRGLKARLQTGIMFSSLALLAVLLNNVK
ncbi:BIIDXI-like protein At5g11420 [Typha angustifolia]|uniref:BIIDXI-like protein At5g11420 n=1 Tax=Typha angustifolia TaxID=59011 RepID=UPI003C2D5126